MMYCTVTFVCFFGAFGVSTDYERHYLNFLEMYNIMSIFLGGDGMQQLS